MQWNYAPEVTSALFLLVILAYSLRYRMLPSRRNRLFVMMLNMVFALVCLSIVTVMMSGNTIKIPLEISIIVHTLFFLTYPLVPVLFLWYLITVIFEHRDRLISILMITSYLPKLVYDAFVLVNPFSGFLFAINATSGYVAGKGEVLIFAIAILYMLLIAVLAFLYRKLLNRQLTNVILAYNFIFIGFLVIELFIPSLVLGGTAATLFIFTLYLYIQNKEVMTDRLTNLMNRPAAVEQLRLLDKSDISAHLILISLSDFRTVNGLYGQQFGDALLTFIADFLITVSRAEEVYRYSGDMFLLILREDRKKADEILNVVVERFKKPFSINGTSTTIRAKFVYAQYPEHVKSSENAVALLEFLIAKAKQDTKENVLESSDVSLQDMTRRSRIIEIVKKAVENDSFTIVLQPIYSIKNGSYTKAEALLRLFEQTTR